MNALSVRAGLTAALVWVAACGGSERAAPPKADAGHRSVGSASAVAASSASEVPLAPRAPPATLGSAAIARTNICAGPPPSRAPASEQAWSAVTSESVQAMHIKMMGEITAARRIYEGVLPRAQAIGDQCQLAGLYHSYGEVLMLQDELGAARSWIEKAIATTTMTGDKLEAIAARLSLARVSLEQGAPVEAMETTASLLKEVGDDPAQARFRIEAALIRAAAFELQGDLVVDAEREAAKAAAQAKQAGLTDRDFCFAIPLLRARARLARQGLTADAATSELKAVAATASKAGCLEQALEAERALGLLMMRSGRADDGKALLDNVAERARAKGFLLLARRAGPLATL